MHCCNSFRVADQTVAEWKAAERRTIGLVKPKRRRDSGIENIVTAREARELCGFALARQPYRPAARGENGRGDSRLRFRQERLSEASKEGIGDLSVHLGRRRL